MKVIKLFKPSKEYSKAEVQKILRDNNKKRVALWPQVWGWSVTYATEPTIATPAGSHRKYITV